MTTIVVSRDLGERVVTREHGRVLRDLVEQRLGTPPVVVDFEGLQITSVSFFDEAFGKLAQKLGVGILDVVKLERIDPFDLALVQDIIHSRAEEARKRAAGG